ncbi:hypothetical protein MTO96_043892 [Rhipicephalus appendiculatus]
MAKTIHYVEKFTQHKVIYGDTDSVMIHCEGKTVAAAMDMGKELAERISSQFPDPIRLEFEKVYKPYLLTGTKRYAGAMYSSNPESHDKIDIKGLDTVRKDCTPYVSRVTKECIQRIIEGHTEDALNIATKAVDDLLWGRVDISELILYRKYTKKKPRRLVGVTKKNTKGGKCTKKVYTKPPHLVVVEKRNSRGGKPPKVGDLIPYVTCKELVKDKDELRKEDEARPKEFKRKKDCERKIAYKAEDPDYVTEKHLPIDYAYYVTKKLRRPLLKLFGPVLSDGDHDVRHDEDTAAKKIWPTKRLESKTGRDGYLLLFV